MDEWIRENVHPFERITYHRGLRIFWANIIYVFTSYVLFSALSRLKLNGHGHIWVRWQPQSICHHRIPQPGILYRGQPPSNTAQGFIRHEDETQMQSGSVCGKTLNPFLQIHPMDVSLLSLIPNEPLLAFPTATHLSTFAHAAFIVHHHGWK